MLVCLFLFSKFFCICAIAYVNPSVVFCCDGFLLQSMYFNAHFFHPFLDLSFNFHGVLLHWQISVETLRHFCGSPTLPGVPPWAAEFVVMGVCLLEKLELCLPRPIPLVTRDSSILLQIWMQSFLNCFVKMAYRKGFAQLFRGKTNIAKTLASCKRKDCYCYSVDDKKVPCVWK